MTALPPNATIQQIQTYVALTERNRGFNEETALQKCLLLGEEMGELFKAIRAHSNIKVDATSEVGSIGDELADILNFVVAIANRFNIDLESAFRE